MTTPLDPSTAAALDSQGIKYSLAPPTQGSYSTYEIDGRPVYVAGGTDPSKTGDLSTPAQTYLSALSDPYLNRDNLAGYSFSGPASVGGASLGTGTSGGTPSTGAAGGGMTVSQRDAFASVSAILAQYGLESLGPTVQQWAQQDLSPSEIALKLYDTPEFKNEYGGVMDARKKAGLPAVSVSDILGYRKSAAELFQAAGLPKGFHDDKSDYDKFIAGDVSLSELSDRINLATQAAYKAPQEARDALAQWGMGPGDMTAFWLNPDVAQPLLERKFAAAQLAGASMRTGYGSLSENQATALAQQGVTQDQAQSGFGQLQQSQELFGALDSGEQSFNRDEQIGATFGSNPNAARRIAQQARRRVATFEQGGSFAAANTGVSGLGSAPR